jgi:hypothetical protein
MGHKTNLSFGNIISDYWCDLDSLFMIRKTWWIFVFYMDYGLLRFEKELYLSSSQPLTWGICKETSWTIFIFKRNQCLMSLQYFLRYRTGSSFDWLFNWFVFLIEVLSLDSSPACSSLRLKVYLSINYVKVYFSSSFTIKRYLYVMNQYSVSMGTIQYKFPVFLFITVQKFKS